MDDRELLRQFVEQRSESAFSELVGRHLNMVYATAFRLVGDPHLAEEVAQSVFILLSRKAGSIREGNALPGWLYRATCGIAKDTIRGEQRRRKREIEAVTLTEGKSESPSVEESWQSIAPVLEEAMSQLKVDDQDAIILRFLKNKSLAEVGRSLQVSEDTAQKRVSRALEKLRHHLRSHGLSIPVTVLASSLAVPAAQAAPSGLAATLAPIAFAAGNSIAAGANAIGMSVKLKAGISLFLLVGAAAFLAVFFLHPDPAVIRSSLATFRGLGDLPGGEFISYASALSSDGKVVVGVSRSTNGMEAFRWEDGRMLSLGDLPEGGFSSSAYAVSSNGAVIVGMATGPSGAEAFRWTLGQGMNSIGFLTGGFSSMAYGISGDGQFVVGEGSSERTEREAFRWDASSMRGLGAFSLQRFSSQAMGASSDGSTVIGISSRSSVNSEAFYWTLEKGMVGLGDFPGGVTNSNAFAVSPDGRFVVGYGCPGTFDPFTHEAFRWSETTGLVPLGFAPGLRNSAAYALSAEGNIIVGDNKSERPAVALIWDPRHRMRRLQQVLTNDYKLNLRGWQLTGARGVSHDGKTIVGTGLNPRGQTEAWMVHLKVLPDQRGQP